MYISFHFLLRDYSFPSEYVMNPKDVALSSFSDDLEGKNTFITLTKIKLGHIHTAEHPNSSI